MWIFRWIIIFIFIVLIIWFAIENADQKVTIKLFKYVFTDVPLVLVMFESFILGVIVWFLVSLFQNLKLKVQLKSIKNINTQLEKELKEMKDTLSEQNDDNIIEEEN